MNEIPKVKSLYKALSLLDLFSVEDNELSVTEIAQKANLLKSTVHNIMSTFALYGIIEQNPLNKKYAIGRKSLLLSNIYNNSNDLSEKINSNMKILSEEIGEIVYYGIPYDTNVIYISASAPRDHISAPPISGIIAPMYCTAIGKSLLAFSDESLLQKFQEVALKSFTENTITRFDTLKKELDETKNRGYSIDNMEHEYGVKCIGMPIIINGQIVAALSISGPSLRFSDDKIQIYAEKLKSTINQIIS